MNRQQLEDTRLRIAREATFFADVVPNCTRCAQFNSASKSCAKFGQVPEEFINVGCDEWELDDCPI